MARAAGQRLLTVVGPSGSGKSSVVRAGLLAALRHGAALVLVPDVRGVDLARVVAQEAVTATLGLEVPGTRVLGPPSVRG